MIRKYAILGLIASFLIPALTFVCSAFFMEKADAKAAPPRIEGIFWQVDQMSQASGNWHLLGVNTLVTQWSIVDGRSFFNEIPGQQWEVKPEWQSIAEQPWSKQVILGLAGIFQEPISCH